MLFTTHHKKNQTSSAGYSRTLPLNMFQSPITGISGNKAKDNEHELIGMMNHLQVAATTTIVYEVTGMDTGSIPMVSFDEAIVEE
jgi:hypothetical protein